VYQCSSRHKVINDGDSDPIRFYKFPAVNPRACKELQDLRMKQRKAWMAAVKRENITEDQLNKLRICSKHFLSGTNFS